MKTKSREVNVSSDQFKKLLKQGLIRAASLQDVEGLHHSRALYRHPITGQYYVAVRQTYTGEL